MTDWKDTVMSRKQIDIEMDRIEKLDTSYTTAELELCNTQAEISFKAGERKIVEWIDSQRTDKEKEIGLATISWDMLIARLEWRVKSR